MPERLGDAPVQKKYREDMNKLAATLDKIFNGDLKGAARKTGFVLLVFPFNDVGEGARANYISNAERADVIVMLKEQLARFEGQAEVSGHV